MADIDPRLKELLEEYYRKRKELNAIIGHLEAAAGVAPETLARPSAEQGAADWAEWFLRSVGNVPTHYREIARQVVNHGYRGKPRSGENIGSDAHVDRVAHSMRGAFYRETERFETAGGARFRLKNPQDVRTDG